MHRARKAPRSKWARSTHETRGLLISCTPSRRRDGMGLENGTRVPLQLPGIDRRGFHREREAVAARLRRIAHAPCTRIFPQARPRHLNSIGRERNFIVRGKVNQHAAPDPCQAWALVCENIV